ncbi:hypothetical protein YC2023_031813 [Brassica napus]
MEHVLGSFGTSASFALLFDQIIFNRSIKMSIRFVRLHGIHCTLAGKMPT